MTTREVPPIPEPPAGAGSLVLDVGDTNRILFALHGVMPTECQLYDMRRRVARTVEQYGGEDVPVRWRWIR